MGEEIIINFFSVNYSFNSKVTMKIWHLKPKLNLKLNHILEVKGMINMQ